MPQTPFPPPRTPAGPGATPPDPEGPASEPLGLYIHIPFCERKCPYCDFNTYADLDALFAPTVEALCRELADWGPRLAGRRLATVFLGGGTPTVLPLALLERVLAAVHAAFDLAPAVELTSEANPGTVDRERFAGLRALGVNRLSLGAQSLDEAELAFLGRIHGADEIRRAFDAARAAGFDNINLDFMFGLPGQAAATWRRTLDGALALGPEHLSLYSLIVEANTPLHGWVASGRVPAPDEDAAAEHYEQAQERLAAAGYTHYEVSNWARPGLAAAGGPEPPAFASRHNLGYWRNGEWLGVGPGAHSQLRWPGPGGPVTHRWANLRPVPGYLRRVAAGEAPAQSTERIAARTAMGETMMLGLRLLREGVSLARFRRLHGLALGEAFAAELAELEAWGLLDLDAERVRLTARGLAIGNQVFARFL